MTTPEPIPFGFAGKPQVADTDRIPMVVVPVELLRRAAVYVERQMYCEPYVNRRDEIGRILADLQDAIAQE